MKRKLAYLTGVFFLFFIGLLAVDIQSNQSNYLISDVLTTSAYATSCGSGYLNHQTWKLNATICYGPSGAPTDFTALPYNDCKDELNSCCPFPELAPTCPTIGD